ncbi:MAG: type II toxin-antitoxin system RelE/ParE family toxin [Acidobacteriota bacterium]
MKQLRVHPGVLLEAEAAVEWYGRRSPRAALRFLDEFRSAIQRIREAPEEFPRLAFDTRRIVLRHFPYIAVFHETESMMEIAAVAHGRRRPDYWRERLT